jgi:formylglycine-generating enzyme required for sulfatase activity
MNCITWYELFAFCAWDGGRLPTFAELHYAFSGGSEQRVYPWSVPPENSTVDGTFALYAFNILMPPPLGPVGARPRGKGRWGHYDLAGNVTEWAMDTETYQVPCNDCVQLRDPGMDPPVLRLATGGSFREAVEALRVYPENSGDSRIRDSRMGGRCVRE